MPKQHQETAAPKTPAPTTTPSTQGGSRLTERLQGIMGFDAQQQSMSATSGGFEADTQALRPDTSGVPVDYGYRPGARARVTTEYGRMNIDNGPEGVTQAETMSQQRLSSDLSAGEIVSNTSTKKAVEKGTNDKGEEIVRQSHEQTESQSLTAGSGALTYQDKSSSVTQQGDDISSESSGSSVSGGFMGEGVGVKLGSDQSQSTTVAGQGTTASSSSSSGSFVATDDGFMLGGERKDVQSSKGPGEKDPTSSREETMSANVGLTSEGLVLSGSAGRTDKQGDASTGAKIDQKTVVSTKGASQSTTGTWSQSDGTYKRTFSLGGKGSVSMDVEPLPMAPGTAAPKYQTVFVISLGGSVSMGAEREEQEGARAQLTGSGSLSGGGEVKVTHKRVLDDAKVEEYIRGLETWEKGEAPPALPEMAILTRLSAFQDEVMSGSGADATAVLGSASSARGMEAGESYDLAVDLTGSVGAKIGAKSQVGLGASAGFSASGELSRSVSVRKVDAETVTVVLTFKTSRELSGELGVAAEGGTMGISGKDTRGSDNAATFTLRTNAMAYDYDTVFGEIMGAWTVARMKDLATSSRYQAWGITTERTEGSSRGSSMDVTAGAGGLAAKAGEASEYADSIKYTGQDGLEGTVMGKHSSSLEVSASVLKVGGQVDEQADIAVDRQGDMTGSFGTTTKTTLPGFNGTLNIKELLVANFSSYRGIDLDEEDMEILIDRAHGDKDAWESCAFSTGRNKQISTIEAWWALRTQITHARPKEEWTDQNPAVAMRLAQAVAMAEFVSSNSGGNEIIEACCREYRVEDDLGRVTEGEDVGALEVWPRKYYEEKAKFDKAEADVKKLPSVLSGYAGDTTDGDRLGRTHCRDLLRELYRIKGILENNPDDFANGRARLEMIHELDGMLEDVREELDSFKRISFGAEGESPLSEAGDDEAAAVAKAKRQVSSLLTLLKGYKGQEQALFQTIKEHTDDYTSEVGFLNGGYRAYLPSFSDARVEASEQIRLLYEEWKRKILELREAYTAATIDQVTWEVSVDSRDYRNEEHEPDALAFKEIMVTVAEDRGIDPIRWFGNKSESEQFVEDYTIY